MFGEVAIHTALDPQVAIFGTAVKLPLLTASQVGASSFGADSSLNRWFVIGIPEFSIATRSRAVCPNTNPPVGVFCVLAQVAPPNVCSAPRCTIGVVSVLGHAT